MLVSLSMSLNRQGICLAERPGQCQVPLKYEGSTCIPLMSSSHDLTDGIGGGMQAELCKRAEHSADQALAAALRPLGKPYGPTA